MRNAHGRRYNGGRCNGQHPTKKGLQFLEVTLESLGWNSLAPLEEKKQKMVGEQIQTKGVGHKGDTQRLHGLL